MLNLTLWEAILFYLPKHTVPGLLQLPAETFFFILILTYNILLSLYLKKLSDSK